MMGQNSASQIHVKIVQGYSPKYTEHVFSVNGIQFTESWPWPQIAIKSQIATVEISDMSQFVTVAICDGSKLRRLMSIVLVGILLIT